jgi:transcriptional adapter 2-alpha
MLMCKQVRIRCAHPICHEFDLCVPCFSAGEHSKDHEPKTHPYTVVEQHSIPIYDEDWGADEELLLLEGAESYGLGSWADIADHIGGYRTKDEVRDHYINTYINSSRFPLPERASPEDRELLDIISREEFQSRKKRRIEERKEAARTAPPAPPKQKPTASVPACHEISGYMPGRMEFEHEHLNEAEEAVQHMQFEPGDGINPKTGELEPEMELKMTVMDIYNSRLTARVDRKKIMFEHKLLEYRKNAASEKMKTKEERDLLNKAKPFARMVNHLDFEAFNKGLLDEHNLRLAVAQLQEWRQMRLSDLRTGEKYEKDKKERLQKVQSLSALDRLATARTNKTTGPIEAASAAAALTGRDLPDRFKPKQPGAPSADTKDSNGINGRVLTNGHANGIVGQHHKVKYTIPPLSNVQALDLNNENATDLHLLTKDEQQLCSVLRILPKPYLVIKEHLMKEAMKQGGKLKKKAAREICKVFTLQPSLDQSITNPTI